MCLEIDTDGDGVGDLVDEFPNDPNESVDSDGVGDNGDVFPNDPNESGDADGDGVGDNGDAFPNDPAESGDADGDGVGDNEDAFPNDPDRSASALTFIEDATGFAASAVIGALVGLLVIVGIILYMCMRKKEKDAQIQKM